MAKNPRRRRFGRKSGPSGPKGKAEPIHRVPPDVMADIDEMLSRGSLGSLQFAAPSGSTPSNTRRPTSTPNDLSEEEFFDSIEQDVLTETDYGRSMKFLFDHTATLRQQGKWTLVHDQNPASQDKYFKYVPESNTLYVRPLSVELRRTEFESMGNPHKLMSDFHERLHVVQDLSSRKNELDNILYIEERMLDPNEIGGEHHIRFTPDFFPKYCSKVMTRQEVETILGPGGQVDGNAAYQHFMRTWQGYQETAFQTLAIFEAHAYIAIVNTSAESLYRDHLLKRKRIPLDKVSFAQFEQVFNRVYDLYALFEQDPRGPHRTVAETIGQLPSSIEGFCGSVDQLKGSLSSKYFQEGKKRFTILVSQPFIYCQERYGKRR